MDRIGVVCVQWLRSVLPCFPCCSASSGAQASHPRRLAPVMPRSQSGVLGLDVLAAPGAASRRQRPKPPALPQEFVGGVVLSGECQLHGVFRVLAGHELVHAPESRHEEDFIVQVGARAKRGEVLDFIRWEAVKVKIFSRPIAFPSTLATQLVFSLAARLPPDVRSALDDEGVRPSHKCWSFKRLADLERIMSGDASPVRFVTTAAYTRMLGLPVPEPNFLGDVLGDPSGRGAVNIGANGGGGGASGKVAQPTMRAGVGG